MTARYNGAMPPRADKSSDKSVGSTPDSRANPGVAAPTSKSFEKGLEELESIVQELERGELSLEDSILLFEKGIALSNACRSQLAEAETRVEVLLRKGAKMVPEPFPQGGSGVNEKSGAPLGNTPASATGDETVTDDDLPF